MKTIAAVGFALLAALAVACGDDDDEPCCADDSDAAVAVVDASIDSGFSGEICDDSPTGSSNGLDCAAFCAPLEDLECAAVVRTSTCQAWCEQLKTDCEPQFNHFVDCAGAVPGWACIGTTLIAGSCTVALDCPCINPLMQGCSGDMAGDEPAADGELLFVASVAECVDVATPDPDACRTAGGTPGLTVDQSTSIAGNDGATAAAFFAFELDDSFTAGEVTAVTLELGSGGFGGDSDQSGDVWQVAAFTRDDLFTSTPAQLGADPVGVGVGQVSSCQVVSWPLSMTVEPNTTVYLGVFPTSYNGVDYFAIGGELEPRLRITR